MNEGNNMVFLSIIMPIYNEKKEWIISSIESICNQTFEKFEFIIIIDNPENQEAIELLDYYAKCDKRIRYYINEENIGLVNTLNKGLALCSGEFIARMDADDIALPDRLKKQVEFLEINPDIGLVGSNWICIDENGQELFKHGKLATDFNFIKNNIKYNNMFLHPSWMFRRKIIEEGLTYRNIDFCEDYDFITLLITNNIRISNINEYLMKYRIRSSSISVSKSFEQYINSCKVIEFMRQRIKSNDDRFDEYKGIILKNKEKEKFLRASNMFIKSRSALNEKEYLKFFKYIILSSLISKYRFKKNMNIIIFNIKIKLKNK